MRRRLRRPRWRWAWRCSLVALCAVAGAMAVSWVRPFSLRWGEYGVGVRRSHLCAIKSAVPFQLGRDGQLELGPFPGGVSVAAQDERPFPGISYSALQNVGAPGGAQVAQIQWWLPLAPLVLVSGVLWWVSGRRVRPGRCVWCDYDLTGAVGKVCPECGRGQDRGAKEGAQKAAAAL